MRAKITAVLSLLIYLYLSRRSLALNQEMLVLRQMRLSLSDTSRALDSWTSGGGGGAAPCNWTGVACDRRGSVVSVSLPSASLAGPFPIELCCLPSLSNLSLSDNNINGTLPLAISSCRSLVYLDLSENLLVGPLPPTLADLHSLRYLNLMGNNFSGDIPTAFGRFKRLESLILVFNLLNGTIPSALGNITTLKNLQLAYNPFSPGPIPAELGNLTNLEYLWLTNCQLVGRIPISIGHLSRIQNLDLACNGLTGPIPAQITHMTSIVQIELYNNSLNGTLPAGWSNLTKLRRFDSSMNELTGIIPVELCELPLESLALYENRLEGIIPDSIATSANLHELRLFDNRLRGTLPSDLGKNSPLQILDVSYNSHLSGEIPELLCLNKALVELIMLNNALTGNIPANLGNCPSLLRVRLRGNRLQGEVPPQLWGLPRVYLLELSGNELSGNISSTIGGAKNLSVLAISNNRFSGSIPSEIGQLDCLVDFSAGSNFLTGEIPSSIINLRQLGRLDLSNNNLSGGIPKEINSLKLLNELDLGNNRLSGHIPDKLGHLPTLNYLDLSNNNFSGEIPLSLQNLKLNSLNLSQNMLSGDVPPLFSDEAHRDSFLGNPELCFYNSSSCNRKAEEEDRVFLWVTRFVFTTTSLVLLVGIIWFVSLRCRKIEQMAKKDRAAVTKWTSFHKLAFNDSEIINDLKESNVIGGGASGKVYKLVTSNGEEVAVKKLHEKCENDENNPEFDVEVETLGKIRHKNIVKLLSCCDAENYKLLVYEYMPNGSLGDLLHGGEKESEFLDWPTRFLIALGAAEGLSYLHHDCDPPIVHRDVKSNNLLLDEEFGVKISDFGVAKVVKEVENGVESMSVIAGSCGYIAPEYAYTLRVNEKSDIYSFGIVILELVTRKLPTDPELGGRDLATWVSTTLESGGIDQVIDPNLDSSFHEHIRKVIDIGLVCSSTLPTSRPSMRRVVSMLRESGASMFNNHSVHEKE
ncbi:leucine-rich receptor-like protein kinase family protein [Striga asiatica]|uniref:non-specific serine/threonine protein kinase n=1 Tax=Striga asiatica TaxID=4170 RepID=A0A5A7QFG7_STRAF|nr:leucine-rich receptor-like protein kinase family protein [Striga asiatica]